MKTFYINDANASIEREVDDIGQVHYWATPRFPGVVQYRGSEVGRPDVPYVDIYISLESIMDEQILASYADKPVTRRHPPKLVNIHTLKNVAKGHISAGYRFKEVKGVKLPQVKLVITDASLANEIDNGMKGVSVGFEGSIDWTAGSGPYGSYQGTLIMGPINHLAVCPRGRLGDNVTILDEDSLNELNNGDMLEPEALKAAIAEALTPILAKLAVLEKGIADLKAMEEQEAASEGAPAKTDPPAETKAEIKDEDLNAEIEKRFPELFKRRTSAIEIARHFKIAINDEDTNTAIVGKVAQGLNIPAPKTEEGITVFLNAMHLSIKAVTPPAAGTKKPVRPTEGNNTTTTTVNPHSFTRFEEVIKNEQAPATEKETGINFDALARRGS